MSNEDKIKEELQEIWFTLLNAKTAYNYAKYLFEPPTIEEQSYMRHYGVEMQFFRSVLWRNSVIEISNLFKREERRSINKFLNKVESYGEYRNIIPKETIDLLREKLVDNKEIIEKILMMRDKVFAHAQKEYKDSLQYNVLDKDIEKLISFAEAFISDIYLVFNAQVIHDHLSKKEFYLLKVLNEYEENKRKEIIERYKDFSKGA